MTFESILGLWIYRMCYIIIFIDQGPLTNVQSNQDPFTLSQKLPVCLILIRPSHSVYTLQKDSKVIMNRIGEAIASQNKSSKSAQILNQNMTDKMCLESVLFKPANILISTHRLDITQIPLVLSPPNVHTSNFHIIVSSLIRHH